MKYAHAVVAGTFDRFHRGHEAVLIEAFRRGQRVIIGLTSDEYVTKFKIQNSKFKIRPYAQRKNDLLHWLTNKGFIERTTIISLDDPYGSVVPSSPHAQPAPDTRPPARQVEAIVVSTETRPRAEKINQLRCEAGWKPLAIVEVAMVLAEDLAAISSTRVRVREIDRDGRLILPDNLRPELQKPLGSVLVGEEIPRSIAAKQSLTLIAVGDVATKTFLDAGVMPSLAIIDGKVGRKPFHETLKMLQLQKVKPFEAKAVKSGPGYISGEATRVLRSRIRLCRTIQTSPAGSLVSDTGNQRIKKHHVIIVDGEEDLLALPAIAEAPVGSVVYYGQPDKGLVEVVVTKSMKQHALALLARFLS